MSMAVLQVLGVRLVVPLVTFGSNLLLLRYFGSDRFAVLATLLQGSLLCSVLLKFGRDDALLYGRLEHSTQRVWSTPKVLASVGTLVLMPLLPADPGSAVSVAGFVIQIALLGLLNAELTVMAMRLQVQDGRPWAGNLCFAMAGPVSVLVGHMALSSWLAPALATDGLWFGASLALGYLSALILMQCWQVGSPPEPPGGSTLAEGGEAVPDARAARQLWLLQVIDVVLLSGDLILLGLLDRRAGLGMYIAAQRLAVASAFINLAVEQAMATLQRSGASWKVPTWALPLAMLLTIPVYLLLLLLLGLRPGQHFDAAVVVIVMAGAAAQSLFLQRKVRWAGAVRGAASTDGLASVLVVTLLASAGLCCAGLWAHWSAPWRASAFVVLALSVRAVLAMRMRSAPATGG